MGSERASKSRLSAAAGLVVVGAAFLLAACGGTSGPGVASVGSTTTTSPAVGTANPSPFQGPAKEYGYALTYAECMRTHGVPDFPDPTRSNHGFSFNPDADSKAPSFSSANGTCKHFLPDDGGPPTAAQLAAETTRLLKFARCMRTHGEPNFPDPIISPHMFGFSINGIDLNSSQYKKAQRACSSLSPFG